MRIDELPEGSRFRCANIEKTGTLLYVTAGSATVQWDSAKAVTLKGKTFTVREAPQAITRAAEVVPLK